MRKNLSQITIAIVCALLGFMLTYEFKLLYFGDKDLNSSNNYTNGAEISAEAEALSKQGSELRSKQIELYNQLKKYEENVTNQEELKKQIDNQLSEAKTLLGLKDVEGAGIIVNIVYDGASFMEDNANIYLKEEELMYIVNELKFAGAEAIAINDQLLTSQSAIKSTEDGSLIIINDVRISPRQKIEIKAIGDKENLYSALSFAGTLEHGALYLYRIDISPMDSIKIPKYDWIYKTEYLRRKQ